MKASNIHAHLSLKSAKDMLAVYRQDAMKCETWYKNNLSNKKYSMKVGLLLRGPLDLEAGGSERPGPKMHQRGMIKSNEAVFYISEPLKAINYGQRFPQFWTLPYFTDF